MRAHHVANAPAPDPALVERVLAPADLGESARAASRLAVAAYATRSGKADLLERVKPYAAALETASDQQTETDAEVAVARLEIQALLAAGARPDSAVELLRSAVEASEDIPYVFGPAAAAVKPPGEVLGELLLEIDRPAEAAAVFERTLRRTPGRRASLEGLELARTRTGDTTEEAIALVGVSVLSMDTERVLDDYTIVIADGLIAEIGPTPSIAIAPGTRIVDGRGLYAMPGLVDAHVHFRSDRELASYLRYGVTTIVNLSGTPPGTPDILETRHRIARGELVGPTIFTTGPTLDGDPPDWAAVSTVVTSAAEAEAAIEREHRAGYDFIKLYNGVAPDIMAAAIAAAHDRDMAAFGHIPRDPEPARALERALAAGLDVVAHGEEVFFTYAYPGVESVLDEGGIPYRDSAQVERAADLLLGAGAAMIPNLSFIAATRRQLYDLPGVLGDPEVRYLDPDTREAWDRYNVSRRSDLERFDRRERAKYRFVQQLTRALARRGVPLFLGTDTALTGLFPGLSAHLELEELVKAGLTPFEALKAGTATPGSFLARHVPGTPPFGILAPGARADLVLLDANPLEDIRNANRIEGIVLRGRWYSVTELEGLRLVDE